jgi:hypothetical protein
MPTEKNLLKTVQSFVYGNKGFKSVEGLGSNNPMPLGYEYLTGIVIDCIVVNASTYLRKKLVEKPSFPETVKNFHMLNKTPPNSIIVKLIDRGEGLTSDTVHVALPFFSPHLAMPLKPGEFVWILKESDEGVERYYWVSRKHGIDQIDDINYTLLERSDVVEQKIQDKIKEKSAGKKKKSAIDNPLDENKEIEQCHSYLPGQVDQENYTDYAYTNQFIVKNTADFRERFSYEVVPKISKNPGDMLLQGSNNAFVQLTTEKFKNETHVDVLKNEPAIDICIGRKNEDINNINEKTAATIEKVINSDKEGSYISAVASLIDGDLDPVYELNKVANLFEDIENEKDYFDQSPRDCAGRIYMSKNCNVDTLFSSDFDVLSSHTGQSVVVYSDHNRIIGESTVRLASLSGESFLNMDNEGNVVLKSSIDDGQQFLSLINNGTTRLQAKNKIELAVRADNNTPQEPYILHSELAPLLKKLAGDAAYANFILDTLLQALAKVPPIGAVLQPILTALENLRTARENSQAGFSEPITIEFKAEEDPNTGELIQPPPIETALSLEAAGNNITQDNIFEDAIKVIDNKIKSTKIFGEGNN